MTQKNSLDIQTFYLLDDDTSTLPEELNTAETEIFYSQEVKYLNKRKNLKNDEKYSFILSKKNIFILQTLKFLCFCLLLFSPVGLS